ncbi:MAG TPA: biopolymer transporter ExbD [Terracidiphilus sp.]|nr:biopolymer transporter ExbD [Terracidiphilus sp.]
MTLLKAGDKDMASEINVTPMIDVLLVLLIIFMVIVPATPRGETALVPHPARRDAKPADAVVLEVIKGAGGAVGFRINQQPVAKGELQSRLAAVFATRAQRVLFVKGDDQLSFTQVAEVIDIGHSAGIDQIGLMTPGTVALP